MTRGGNKSKGWVGISQSKCVCKWGEDRAWEQHSQAARRAGAEALREEVTGTFRDPKEGQHDWDVMGQGVAMKLRTVGVAPVGHL